jgi:hypothetical protein
MAEKAEGRTLVDPIPMRFVSFWRLIGDNFLPAAEWHFWPLLSTRGRPMLSLSSIFDSFI